MINSSDHDIRAQMARYKFYHIIPLTESIIIWR
jgi:hypothetical protein